MLAGLLAALIVAAPAAPDWSKDELKKLFAGAEAASQLQGPAQNAALANLGGEAYRVPARAGESPSTYSRRVLLTRDPELPTLEDDSWVYALTRQLYLDLSARAGLLGRFELDRRDQRYLEEHSGQAKAGAEAIAPLIRIKIPGIEGFMPPLPKGTADTPTKPGALTIVREGKIKIEELNRITFESDRPAASAERTGSGALRQLYSALKQYNIHASMMGRVDPLLAQGFNQLRIFAPAAAPSIYLNEVARAAIEAEMKTCYVMVIGPGSKGLQQIPLMLDSKGKGKKTKEPVAIRCGDNEPIQSCVDKMIEGRAQGPLRFVLSKPE